MSTPVMVVDGTRCSRCGDTLDPTQPHLTVTEQLERRRWWRTTVLISEVVAVRHVTWCASATPTKDDQ